MGQYETLSMSRNVWECESKTLLLFLYVFFFSFQILVLIFSEGNGYFPPILLHLYFHLFFIFNDIAHEFRRSCQTTGVQVSYHKGKVNMIISCDFLHLYNLFCVIILSVIDIYTQYSNTEQGAFYIYIYF